jgi:signal recognition particle GTPase
MRLQAESERLLERSQAAVVAHAAHGYCRSTASATRSRGDRAHQVVIVCGETGSGKTTQIPKICLELAAACTA